MSEGNERWLFDRYLSPREDRRFLGRLVQDRAAELGDKIFAEFDGDSLSFTSLDSRSDRVAGALRDLGVVLGDRVAIMLPNCAEFVLTWVGAAKIGAAEVAVNVALRGEGLAHLVSHCGARVLVTDGAGLEVIEPMLDRFPRLETVVVVGEASVAPEVRGKRCVNYADLEAGRRLEEIVELDEAMVHSVMYTSGTTGPSKGVLVSHGYFDHYARTFAAVVGIQSDDRIYMVLPLYHVNPQLFVYGSLAAGATLIFRVGFSASRFWADVNKTRATIIDCMGIMPAVLLRQEAGEDERSHAVRVAYVVPATAQIIDGFRERFGLRVIQSYGSTESNCPTHFPAWAPSDKAGSAGRAWGPFEVRIVDDAGRELPRGVVGEIVVRSEEPFTMFSGYLNDPVATAEANRDSWYHSGDRGRLDEDGYLWYVDRKKEGIRRSGEMLSPVEVEQAFLTHDDVAECAVVGVPSDLGDDEVLAVVVMRPGATATADALIEHVRPQVARFMVPKFVRVISAMPKTPSEKIEKYKLRSEGVTKDTWRREVR